MSPYGDFFVYTAEALALGANATRNIPVNIDQKADFEVYELCASAISRNFRATIQEPSGRSLSRFSVSGAAFFGDGRRPFRLPVSKKFKGGSSLRVSITDESGAPNQVRLALIGARLYRYPPSSRPEYAAREPFTYIAPFVAAAVDPDGVGTIPAGGNMPLAIPIENESDFELRKLAITYDLATPAGQDSVATILLRDENAQYDFMDRPVPVESLGASRIVDPTPSGFWPYVFRTPKLIQHGHLISATIFNQDPANALSIRVHLIGANLYASIPTGR